MTFDGSAIQGYSRVQESRHARPARPRAPSRSCPGAARTPPSPGCSATSSTSRASRSRATPATCSSATSTAPASKGFTFYTAPEMEFFIFESAEPRPSRIDHAGFFDLTELDMVSDLRRQTIVTLEAMGIPVEYSFHELGPSQHEIDLRYTDALTMADNVMTFRQVVKQVAPSSACTPRSCPSPSRARSARGCTPTCRCSRATSTRSTTPATSSASRRSAGASSPGCCTHAREITAVTNQTVNSYKRLIAGLRGAGPHLLGPQQRVGPRAGAVAEAGQGELDPHRVPLPRPGVQPVPGVLGDAGRRPQGVERGLRRSRPRPPTTSTR